MNETPEQTSEKVLFPEPEQARFVKGLFRLLKEQRREINSLRAYKKATTAERRRQLFAHGRKKK